MLENLNFSEIQKELKTLLNVVSDARLNAIAKTVQIKLKDDGAYLKFSNTNSFLFAHSNRFELFVPSQNAQYYPSLCDYLGKLIMSKCPGQNPLKMESELRSKLANEVSEDLRGDFFRAFSARG